MDVLPLPEPHELLDDEGEASVPHVLPGNARHPWVGKYVGITYAYMTVGEWPVLLRAACKDDKVEVSPFS